MSERMPYIKEYLRPPFDSAVLMLQMKRFGDSAEQIISKVKDMEPAVMDGCLNYVFTQMLRKVNDLTDVKVIMDLVINTLFWMEPKYFKFERLHGLLYCMIEEYQRRSWRRKRKAVKILKELLLINSRKRDEYEDKKIQINSDLR